MIKIVLVEDEIPARKKLKRFLAELDTPCSLVGEVGTVAEGISFFRSNRPDLIFSDIELLDGTAFEIYEQIPVACPIIFTTAYDHFWMNAFETNGIDYLLKPFSKERFQKAWDKFLWLQASEQGHTSLVANLNKLISQSLAGKKYKKRFTLHSNHNITFLDVDNIVLFEARDGVIFAFDRLGKKYLLNYATLKEIECQLDPAAFYRINRSELISKQHIEKIETFTKNTLAIKIKGWSQYFKTSQSNTAGLRQWIEEG